VYKKQEIGYSVFEWADLLANWKQKTEGVSKWGVVMAALHEEVVHFPGITYAGPVQPSSDRNRRSQKHYSKGF
jgi:hypothetical protein